MAVKVMRNRNTKKGVARNSSKKTLTLAKKSTHPGGQHISNETMYRMLIENLPQKMYLKDKNSVYLSCNQNMARDLKINIDEIAGKTDYDFFPKKLAVKYRADDVRIMNSGQAEEIEKSYIRKGQITYIHSVKMPVRDTDGNVTGLLGISWDVTAYKKLEKELEKQAQNLEAVVKEHAEELQRDYKKIEWNGIERRRWQEIFSSLLNSSTVGIYIAENGKFIACNPKFEEITGYNKDELLGRRSLSLVLPADRDAVRNNAMSMLKGQSQIPYQFGLTTRGGEVKCVVESVTSIMYQGKQAVLGNFMDITSLKQTQEILRESENKYRTLMETLQEGVWVIDQEGYTTYVNPHMAQMLGYTTEDMIGRNLVSFMAKSQVTVARTLMERRAQGIKEQHEFEFLRKDGSTIYTLLETGPLTDEKGNYIGAIAGLTDITERKKADEALRENEALLKATGEMAKVGAWELDLSTNQVSWTEEVGRIHGVEPGYQPNLKEALKFYAPESRPAVEAAVKKAAETGEPYDLESLLIPSGSKDKIWVRALGKAVYSGGKVVKLTGAFQNIDKYKRAEEALRESEEIFRYFMEYSPIHVFFKDENIRALRLSKNYEKMLGKPVTELLGKNMDELFPSEFAKKMIADDMIIMKEGKEVTIEEELNGRFYSTTKFPIYIEGKARYLAGFTIDITERKQVGEMLLDNEKKNRELVEQLHRLVENTIAAQEAERERICLEVHDGVAQTMASAHQYLQGMESNLPADFPYVDLINKAKEQIRYAIQEAREIVNSLQPATLKDLGLIPTLRQEMHKIEEENGWKINFNAQAQRFPPAMEIGLYRIIHEAITNIKKHTRTPRVDISILNEGQYINILIKDRGKGFDKDSPDILRKKGVGLISMRKRAELLQGTMDIESIRGQGTTLIIKIPFDGEV